LHPERGKMTAPPRVNQVVRSGENEMSVAKCLAGAAAALLPTFFHCGPAKADEHMVLVDKIDVNSSKGLGAFDISFVNPKLGLYVLADRTNAAVDFFDSRYNRALSG
jgi:hypothetical protein